MGSMFVCYPMTQGFTEGSQFSGELFRGKEQGKLSSITAQGARRHLALATPCSTLMGLPYVPFKTSYTTLTISKPGDGGS